MNQMMNKIMLILSALDWNSFYEIGSMLAKSGIVPGRSYSGINIVNKLSESLGKRPGNLSQGVVH